MFVTSKQFLYSNSVIIIKHFKLVIIWSASLVAQIVKNLPAMQETWVWSLDREDPLEKRMATHSSILAWETWQATVDGLTKSQTQLNWLSTQACYLEWGNREILAAYH